MTVSYYDNYKKNIEHHSEEISYYYKVHDIANDIFVSAKNLMNYHSRNFPYDISYKDQFVDIETAKLYKLTNKLNRIIAKHKGYDDTQLYHYFAYDCCDVMRKICIPNFGEILWGYFDHESLQWIYEPDSDFIKYSSPLSNNAQRYIVHCIKINWELNLKAYTNKKVTIDVKVRTNHGDPERPYLYTVSLKY